MKAQPTVSTRLQTLVGVAVLLLGLAMGAGALTIPSAAGYAGVGPNFLPWLVAVALVICGGVMLYEAQTGGFREMEEPDGDSPRPYWGGFVWMSAGLLANAALITSIGFVFSCTLCFVLAARGLRIAVDGQSSAGLGAWVADAVTGLLIAWPVFLMFTKFLAINLPGITGTGWL